LPVSSTMTTFWHFGCSLSAHLAQTASPVIVFTSAATARVSPEMRATASSGNSLRIVDLQKARKDGRPPPRSSGVGTTAAPFPRYWSTSGGKPQRNFTRGSTAPAPARPGRGAGAVGAGVADAARAVIIRGRVHPPPDPVPNRRGGRSDRTTP